MVAINKLQQTPPYSVEQAMEQLGRNLRTARIRRNLTIADAAERIGTGPRAVMDAERGKASTGIVVYMALLWLYDLLYQMEDVAEPSNDKEGLALQASNEARRVRKKRGLNNDF
jgi:transcriptional regulator with XRE-family HTH domain